VRAVAIERSLPLSGSDYIALLRVAVRRARARVWIQQFVIDARPSEDRFGEVRYLLHSLGEATRRGLDVRLLIPQILSSPEGWRFDVNEAAASFLLARGVAVRRYVEKPPRPHMHAKTVVIDSELAIAGNTNWTPSAFRLNSEQSIAIRSEAFASQVAARFERLWTNQSEAHDFR
jgi:phosphatidylserine/phosphatidylglycerophosphate/cardiolipin synthase-like enzyme